MALPLNNCVIIERDISVMSRLASCFSALAEKNQKALIPYLVVGDPDIENSLFLMHQLVQSGADVIELGIPFSDPMAEGPVIQLAHERALTHQVSLNQVLDLVARFRQTDTSTAVVLMGYANPIEAMGYEQFAEKAEKVGVDGVLVVDMPPEEALCFQVALKDKAIDNIFLLAPTTSEQRIEKVVELASGYLYYVSLKGVTGAGHLDIDSVASQLNLIRSKTDLPICVGFGIKDAESAKQVAQIADGVVVGSALVEKIAQGSKQNLLDEVGAFTTSLRQAIDATI